MSGKKEVSELFAEAERLERENFSLYSYVVEHGATKMQLQEDIDGLELQREALTAANYENDQEQSAVLEGVTAEIQEVDTELDGIRAEKERNETEFASVYVEIEKIVRLLGCSWSETPDDKSTTTPANAFYCLSIVETAIADMVNAVYERTKQECVCKDIRPSSFLPEDRTDVTGGRVNPIQSKLVTDRELASKIGESTKPLTLEELRAMLE
jgi:hypothetical protein